MKKEKMKNCRICKKTLHQKGAHFCSTCAFQKGNTFFTFVFDIQIFFYRNLHDVRQANHLRKRLQNVPSLNWNKFEISFSANIDFSILDFVLILLSRIWEKMFLNHFGSKFFLKKHLVLPKMISESFSLYHFIWRFGGWKWRVCKVAGYTSFFKSVLYTRKTLITHPL